MSVDEFLGWAHALLQQYGLDNWLTAVFVIVLAGVVIHHFFGRG